MFDEISLSFLSFSFHSLSHQHFVSIMSDLSVIKNIVLFVSHCETYAEAINTVDSSDANKTIEPAKTTISLGAAK